MHTLAALGVAGALLLSACAGGLPYRRVRPSVAFQMLRDTPDMLIVDLRDAESFATEPGRVHRAVNLPLDEFPDRWPEIAGFQDTSFLVYCHSNECGVEEMAMIRACGFRYAVLMEGGLERWVREKYGTVLGAEEPASGSVE